MKSSYFGPRKGYIESENGKGKIFLKLYINDIFYFCNSWAAMEKK